MRVCDIEFVVFTDCESCTRPISTYPASMEAGEYGLTRETWFFARRLESVAVAGQMWVSWCVFGGAGFFPFFFFVFFLRTHTTCCKYETASCLIHLSTSDEAMPSKRSDRGRFLPLDKKASSYRGAYRVPLFNWSVRVIRRFY